MLNRRLAKWAGALQIRVLGDIRPLGRPGKSTGRGVSRLSRNPVIRTLLASVALAAAVALAGCNTDGTLPTNSKAMAPLSPKTVSEIEQKGMDKDSPILVRLFKQESELEIWKQDRSGRFELLKTYPICRWSGELGPKIKEGDRQAPEGFYSITPGQMNPNSQYYLSFDLGYPNSFDRAHGRTGSQLMVHGGCSSRGCYSMTDEQIAEIYALGREAFFGGQRSFQVQAYPFRMTPQNLAKHRGNPHMAFWKMLKQGNDHFEVTRQEPRVNVCDRRYVFDAQDPNDPSRSLAFNAAAKCPVFEVPQDVMAAVQDKQRRDEFQTAELVTRGTPVAPVRTNSDGGMHPVFVAAVKRNELGVAPAAFSLASIPATVRPPRIPELADHSVTASAPVAVSAPGPVATVLRTTDPSGPVYEPMTTAMAPTTATSSSGNLFGSLFSSNSKPAAAGKKEDGPLDRMARFIGLRGSDPAPKPPEAVPAAKPKPVVRTATASNGAIRPKSADAEPPVRTAQSERPVANGAVAAPALAAAAPSTPMLGAAPAVPAGSFESRWSGLR